MKNYAWGKSGKESAVALMKRMSEGTVISDSENYAELWMGTHPSGPSTLRDVPGSGAATPLKDYLRERSALVGVVPPSYPGNDLPFLFKVLSVGTALSIQAHPDKALAQQLHADFPLVYKDPNHKPEMALALTTFEALCGFRGLGEIGGHLEAYPELRAVVGAEAEAAVAAALEAKTTGAGLEAVYRTLFSAYAQCDKAVMDASLAELVARLAAEEAQGPPQLPASPNGGLSLDGLILRLHSQYPGDGGVLAPLLLNYLTLAPGQSFFMGANVPHAYLAGDCVECMALSDNVVRVGLTPKQKDVPTLLKMLSYVPTRHEELLLQPEAVDQHTARYRPPAAVCAEFEVELSAFPQCAGQVVLRALPCASIVLVHKGLIETTCNAVDGSADAAISPATVGCGDVLFVPAGHLLTCSCCGSDEDAVLFRAHMNCAE